MELESRIKNKQDLGVQNQRCRGEGEGVFEHQHCYAVHKSLAMCIWGKSGEKRVLL